MGLIYMLLETFYAVIGIAVPVLLIRVFHKKKISHAYFLHLAYSIPAFFMVDSASTIL